MPGAGITRNFRYDFIRKYLQVNYRVVISVHLPVVVIKDSVVVISVPIYIYKYDIINFDRPCVDYIITVTNHFK